MVLRRNGQRLERRQTAAGTCTSPPRWSLRRIEATTGVRRETASGYLKAAGISIGPSGRWGHGPAKPAIEVITGSAPTIAADDNSKPAIEVITGSASAETPARPGRSPTASACEPYRELIETGLERRRDAMAIWQDLVTDHGFAGKYASVMRYVVKLRGARPVEARVVIHTQPGEESQVDYGEGPMVRDAATGKYRRTRLFILTLGYSRKSVRLLSWRSSSRIWAELHERAFRRLGGATRVVVLDNLREGVLRPDAYDPTLNPLYADVLKHYGVTAVPCRVRDPDRKGKTESAVGHTQRTPLKGLRSKRSRRRRRTSIAGTQTGLTSGSTERRSVRSPRCLRRSGRICCHFQSSHFATTSTARERCVSTDTSRSRAPTTPRHRD